MNALTEFLFPAPAPRGVGKIILWWERRRLAYNVAVGAAGLVSLAAVTVVASFIEGTLTIVPWQPIVVFGALANVCYTLGAGIEVLTLCVWGRSVLPVGPALYRMGLTFSVGLALLPTLIVTLVLVARIVFSPLG